MIIHLESAGVPISWFVVSVYKSAMGTACRVAKADALPDEDGSDTPQAVIEVKGSDEGGWAIGRSELFMADTNLARQKPDHDRPLIQSHTAPFPMSEALEAVCRAELHRLLVERGYFVPQDEWRRRYPAQALMQDRFAEFGAAYDASGGKLAYEPRWAVMMEAPNGYKHPARIKDGRLELRRPNGRFAAAEAPWLPDLDDDARLSVCRYVNGGWSLDEARTMITPEPTDGNPATAEPAR